MGLYEEVLKYLFWWLTQYSKSPEMSPLRKSYVRARTILVPLTGQREARLRDTAAAPPQLFRHHQHKEDIQHPGMNAFLFLCAIQFFLNNPEPFHLDGRIWFKIWSEILTLSYKNGSGFSR